MFNQGVFIFITKDIIVKRKKFLTYKNNTSFQ